YLNGIPKDSRIGKGSTWIADELNDEMLVKLKKLNEIAQKRGQKLSQMALSWVLNNKAVTTVLIGASRPEQIAENVQAANAPDLTEEEIREIEAVLNNKPN
ncbi:MAG: aldo/keto reductase, partial [Ruminiclostridium sp.]|nr:aldo/keto reductase [Ruminiclostridium sp.]